MMAASQERFNPFPGLRPFTSDEDYLFFGREDHSNELLRRLRQNRFVAIVGTSGSGKSSLMYAGLLPALYGGFMTKGGSSWRVAVFRPGGNPIGELAGALNHPEVFGSNDEANAAIQATIIETVLRRSTLGLVEVTRQARMSEEENLLVVVDQFEELFRFKETAARGSDDSAAFVKLLLEASRAESPLIYILLTMRSDFLGDCAQFRDLPKAINDGQFLIPRMTREQRRRAIEGPVAVGGAKMTPRLVQRVLNDVGDNPDQLPILQHALMRTWDKWLEDGAEQLDLPYYEAIGGMDQALSQHADEVYAGMPDERSRTIAEKLFKALTDKGPDNRGLRRPTRLDELCAVVSATKTEVIKVIEAFRQPGRSFLVPPVGISLRADSVVDISHESLMRVWEQLKTWVEEESQSAQMYRRLAETAVLYQAGQAGLWSDPDLPELQLALNWRDQNQPNEDWANRYHPAFAEAKRFLEESVKARETKRQAEEAKRQREVERIQAIAEERAQRIAEQERSAKLLHKLLIGLVFVSVLAAVAAVFALSQRQGALAAKKEETRQRQLAEANAKLAEEKRQEADEQRQRAETNAKLAEEKRQEADEQRQRAEEQTEVAISRRLAAQAIGNIETDLELSILLALEAVNKAYTEVTDDIIGSSEAKRDAENALRQVVQAPRIRHTLKAQAGAVNSVAFSPDSKLIATASEDGIAKVWDFKANEVVQTLDTQTRAVKSVVFSLDGKHIATASEDGMVQVWDFKANEVVHTLDTQTRMVKDLIFSLEGKYIAATDADRTTRVWNLINGRELPTLSNNTAGVFSIAFSPDGTRIATADEDGRVRVWNTADGQELLTLFDHSDTILSIAFSYDGKHLATVNENRIVKVWGTESRMVARQFTAHTSQVLGIVFSPEDNLIATASEDGTAKIWDADSGKKLLTLLGHNQPVLGVAFNPSGSRLATASTDGTVKVWDVTHSQVLEAETVKDYSLDVLIQLAEKRVKRKLTPDERREYLNE